MSDDARRSLMRAALSAPYLERDEEHDLAVRWKEHRDQEALHRITTAHMRLVISMAGKFRHFGLPMGDLIQEGHVGLLEAAARFEPDREVRFSTYATWWIRASIQDYILRNWSIVRGGTSSAQKALFFNLRRLRARLAQGTEMLSSASIYQRDLDRARRLGRRRRDDGFAAFGARHLAQRAAGRRRRLVRPHGFPGFRRSAAGRGRRAKRSTSSAAPSGCSWRSACSTRAK